ncbi:MAG: MCE family protein [Calditrichaceae bacterium]|nr:MCE family protein [Calditrichaceae bacterium]MBN2710465.1 MCE family protein [Calditrichaceae bacterium]RQV93600.1 MAG: MCE family protein [Calditrichota bacterium]
MVTKSQKIRLGIFITGAGIILFATLALLSLNRLLEEKDIYSIAYKNISVSGLSVGSSVKYLGLNVGTVDHIEIDPNDISRILVTVGIERGTPIKKDVRADISSIGITGIKIIELRGGTVEAELLEPGEFIQAGKSLTEDITGKAEIIAEKIEYLLNNLLELTSENNRQKLADLMDGASETSQMTKSLLSENKSRITNTLKNIDTISNDMVYAARDINQSLEVLGETVQSDSFRLALKSMTRFANRLGSSDMDKLIGDLSKTVERTNGLLNQAEFILRENRDNFYRSMQELNQTIDYLNNAARQIDEDPSVLIGGSRPDNPPDDKLE